MDIEDLETVWVWRNSIGCYCEDSHLCPRRGMADCWQERIYRKKKVVRPTLLEAVNELIATTPIDKNLTVSIKALRAVFQAAERDSR